MSAAAMQFYDGLLAKGVQADQARKIAEGFDAGREHDRRQAQEHAERAAEHAAARAVASAKEHAEQAVDKAVAHSEEKAKATFATKEQTGQLATRDEMNARFDTLNGRFDALHRLVIQAIIGIIGVTVTIGLVIIGAVVGFGLYIVQIVGGV